MLKSALLRLETEFPALIINRGRDVQRRGAVLNARLSDGLMKARVKGTLGQIYDVYLDLRLWPQSPAQCSCQQKTLCEHVVASLLDLQSKELSADVMVDARRPAVRITADEQLWYSEIENAENGFFSYQLGILIDGKPVDIVPVVAEVIRQWDARTLESLPDSLLLDLPLDTGVILQIPLARIRALMRFLLQYNTADTLQLPRHQLIWMEEVEEAIHALKARWLGTADLKARLQQLLTVTALPSDAVPDGLCTTLRDYQQQGLNWLQCLRASDFGGVLADDMGLGKTIQTLAHLQYEKEQGRLKKACLILSPTSVLWNWFEEAKRFTPQLKVLIFHGLTRDKANFDDYDLVLSTYGLLQRDKVRFLQYPFYYVVLDEAQAIKNVYTKTTQIIHQLQARHRLCLTGTPLENHLEELWSLFNFLMPGLLGTAKIFRQVFRIPIEKHADVERKNLLAARLKPFMLRRTKDNVLSELPAKTDITHFIELTGPQRDLYEAIRMSMDKKVRDAMARQGLARSHLIILDALLKLRQVCCDPRLLTLPDAAMAHGSSAKLDALLSLLDTVMEEGRRVLVFSQFTSMLKLIEDALNLRAYPYLKLTGQTTNRQDLVRSFQEGAAPIFLISLRAGGTGLNLTRADTVIHYDPWWNPAVEDQATDRSHRIGQDNPVFVYKLITAGTVEEVILTMQERKRQLFNGIFTETNTIETALSESDIAQFFKPLG